MSNELKFILMADIISSRKHDQKQLMQDFKELVEQVNSENATLLLSPMTITIGDEFQSVVRNLSAAIIIIFAIEEKIATKQMGFKLRYVLTEGRIDTPINKQIAYGMLGEGLTQARASLQMAKAKKERFLFQVKKPTLSKALNDSFVIYQSLVDAWKISKDYELISEFLELRDYKSVAAELGKTRSQIWKRQKSLRISEYIAIKEVIHYIT